jgi:hypothetical protein
MAGCSAGVAVSDNGALVPATPGYTGFDLPVFVRPFDLAGWAY